jgi:hypothetical protein
MTFGSGSARQLNPEIETLTTGAPCIFIYIAQLIMKEHQYYFAENLIIIIIIIIMTFFITISTFVIPISDLGCE